MKLLLSEGGTYSRPVYGSLAEAIDDNYINVPDPVSGQIIRVREDVFDNLPAREWNDVMDALQPYNDPGMNGLFSNWKQKRADKKEEREQKREVKAETKEIRRAERRDLIRDLGTKFAGAIGGGNVSPMESTRAFGVTGGIDFGTGTPVRKWYENPVVIGGGILALGTLVYFLTRKKKRK